MVVVGCSSMVVTVALPLLLTSTEGTFSTLAFDFADQNLYTVREISLTVMDAGGGVFLREPVPRPFRVSRHFPPGKYSLKVTSRGGAMPS